MRTRGVLDGIAAERPEGRGEEMDRRADRARINYLSKEESKAIAMGGCICAGWNREIHRGVWRRGRGLVPDINKNQPKQQLGNGKNFERDHIISNRRFARGSRPRVIPSFCQYLTFVNI